MPLRIDPEIKARFDRIGDELRKYQGVLQTSRRQVSIRSTGNFLNEATGSKSQRILISDEPEEIGGSNKAPTSLECFLAGLGFNLINIIVMHAASMELKLESLEVIVSGDFAPAGIHGLGGIDSGFKNINFEVRVKSPEEDTKINQLLDIAQRRCPALNTLRSPPRINLSISTSK